MNQTSDHPPRSLPRRGGFTLIELLVVVSIIAILAGLLLPVVSKATDNARKTVAKSAITQMVTAVNNFQTDYGQFPVNATLSSDYASGSDYTFGAQGHNNQLFQILRASETSASPTNSRKVVYFEGKNVRNPGAPRDGFIQDTSLSPKSTAGLTAGTKVSLTAGDLVDPWGNCYIVRIDTSYSNLLMNPYVDSVALATKTDSTTTAPAETDVLRFGTVAMSLGIDGLIGTKGATVSTPYTAIGDDVVSWQ